MSPGKEMLLLPRPAPPNPQCCSLQTTFSHRENSYMLDISPAVGQSQGCSVPGAHAIRPPSRGLLEMGCT